MTQTLFDLPPSLIKYIFALASPKFNPNFTQISKLWRELYLEAVAEYPIRCELKFVHARVGTKYDITNLPIYGVHSLCIYDKNRGVSGPWPSRQRWLSSVNINLDINQLVSFEWCIPVKLPRRVFDELSFNRIQVLTLNTQRINFSDFSQFVALRSLNLQNCDGVYTISNSTVNDIDIGYYRVRKLNSIEIVDCPMLSTLKIRNFYHSSIVNCMQLTCMSINMSYKHGAHRKAVLMFDDSYTVKKLYLASDTLHLVSQFPQLDELIVMDVYNCYYYIGSAYVFDAPTVNFINCYSDGVSFDFGPKVRSIALKNSHISTPKIEVSLIISDCSAISSQKIVGCNTYVLITTEKYQLYQGFYWNNVICINLICKLPYISNNVFNESFDTFLNRGALKNATIHVQKTAQCDAKFLQQMTVCPNFEFIVD